MGVLCVVTILLLLLLRVGLDTFDSMLWDGDDFLGPIVSCVSMGEVHGLERKQKRPVIFVVQLFSIYREPKEQPR